MSTITVTRAIAAKPERVFDTVAHIENFAEVVESIINVEFLSEQRTGVGTRFRETRLMKGREATSTLEVTEYEPHRRIRLVSDEGGAIWDTVFTVKPMGASTELFMVMKAKPYKLLARLMTPLFSGLVRKAIKSDMDAVKAHCEAAPA